MRLAGKQGPSQFPKFQVELGAAMPFSPSGCGQDSLTQTEKAQGDHGGPWAFPLSSFYKCQNRGPCFCV